MTSSAWISVSSGSGFEMVGVGVGCRVVEAEIVVTSAFSRTVEEPCVGPVDSEVTASVVITSGLSEGSVFCASGKISSLDCASVIMSISRVLAVGEFPVWGTDVGAGWLETWSTAVVG